MEITSQHLDRYARVKELHLVTISTINLLKSHAALLRSAAIKEGQNGEYHTATVLIEISQQFDDIAEGIEEGQPYGIQQK